MTLPREELEALVHRYCDGTLTPPETETLNRLLENDRDAARCFAEQTLLHALLRQKCRGQAEAAPRRAVPRWTWAAAAAGALAAAGLALVLLRPGAARWIDDHSGDVALARQGETLPVRAGQAILPGDHIRTGADGRASIRFRGEDTTLFVPADSRVEFDPDQGRGKRIAVGAGRLRCSVAPQPADRPFVVRTPHAEATVLGTTFSLSVSEEQTRLNVGEGRVRFAGRDDGRGPLLVAAREAATADAGGVRAAPPAGPWKEVLSVDFRRGDPLPAGLGPAFCLSRRIDHPDRAFSPDPGIARVRDGALRLSESRARPESMGLATLQWKRPLPDRVRVEVTLPHQPGRQLTITLDGTPFTGYRFNFQPGEHYWRGFHMDRLEVGRHALVQRDSRDIADVGRSHLIVVEKEGETYRAWVDGEERIEKAALPLPPDPQGVALTVGATFTPLEIEAIRILER